MFTLTNHDIIVKTSSDTFDAGNQLYNQNVFPPRMITVSTDSANPNVRIFESSYRSPIKNYHLYMAVSNEDGIKNYYCDCPDAETGDMCKHLVALALSIKNFYSVKEVDGLSKEEIIELEKRHQEEERIRSMSEKRKAEAIRNKNIFKQLIFDYNRINPSVIMNDLVHLEPTIEVGKKNYLSLKIGFDKVYVVNDIIEMLFNIKNEQFFEYGKKLAFYHTYDSFDEQSKKLIDCLSKVTNMDNYQFRNKKYFEVNNALLEDIFTIYKDANIQMIINGNEQEVKVRKDLFDLAINVDLKGITGNINGGMIIDGYQKKYILINKELYELSKINKEVMPLYRLLETYGKITLEDTMDDFLVSIYPRIYKYVFVSDDFKKEHPLYELKIDSYIDEDDGIIILKTKFFIGSFEKSKEELSQESYNHAGYDAYFKYLTYLGFETVGQEMKIIDPYKYIAFLKTDLHGLHDYGDVYLSENLKAIQIKQISKITMNASVNVNMLSVCFADLGFTDEELYKILNAYRKKKKYVKIGKDTVIDLEDENIEELERLVNDLDLDDKVLNETQRKPIYQVLKLSDHKNATISFDEKIKAIIRDIKNYKSSEVLVPSELDSVLRPYQIDAFKWLKTLSKYNLGGILADDMGLGKTLEMLALFLSDEEDKPSLIVSPMSLVYNWQSEIKKWAPKLKSKIIIGQANEREEIINNMNMLEKCIYISSYDSLKRDVDFYTDKMFRFVVLDEGQYIKNYFTQKAKAVKQLSGEVKYSLTGTPIENSLLDLWSIFDFIMPDYLSSYNNFKDVYERNSFDEDVDLSVLVKKITPFVLRRTKKAVLQELPDKFETVCFAKMGKEQRMLYEAYLLKAREQLKSSTSKIAILSILTRLRQICVDPNMFIDEYKGDSAKIDLGMEIILESIQNDHKILAFSQFKSMFPSIIKRLEERNIKYFVITGDTKAEERIKMVDEFNLNDEIKVFLISLKAGGTGLNLTGADIVMHFDPWWNISAENQATDRAHRIGQTKEVQVIKLICEDSIEQKVLELQEMKSSLSDKVITDGDGNITKMDDNDIKYLLE